MFFMIEKETLFVLGAGAGVPYKFPSGKDLRDNIIDYSLNRYNSFNSTEYGKYHDFEREKITERFNFFTKKYLDSKIISIDLFLAMHPKLADIGKKAIVIALNESEKGYLRDVITSTKTYDWMEYLYNKFLINGLKSSATEEIEKFKENKISFITFNYDRSLEYFFWQAISNSFSANQEIKVFDIYSTIKIYHIYGDLGTLDDFIQRNQRGEPLGNIEFVEQVNVVKDNIKTIFEREVLQNQEEVVEMFKKAQRIFFLGFGFAEENIRALNLNEIDFQDKKVYTTGFGLEDEIRRVILNAPTSFSHALDGFVRYTAGSHFPKLDSKLLIKKFL